MTIVTTTNSIVVTIVSGEVLTYTLNCGDVITPTFTGTTFTLNSPEQGIYCFKGVTTGATYRESLYIDAGMKCEFVDKIKITEDYSKYYMYEAMILALDCNQCNCDLACWFYNQILNYISDDCC